MYGVLEEQIKLHQAFEVQLEGQFAYRLKELDKNIKQKPESYWEQFKSRFANHLATVPFFGSLLELNPNYRLNYARHDLVQSMKYAKIGYSREKATTIVAAEREKAGGFVKYVSNSIQGIYSLVQRNPSLARQYQREILRAVKWWQEALSGLAGANEIADTVNRLRASLASDVVFDGLTQGFVARGEDPKPGDAPTLAFLQMMTDVGTFSTVVGNFIEHGLVGGTLQSALDKLKNTVVDATLDTIPDRKKQVTEAVLTYLAEDGTRAWEQYKSRDQIAAAGEVVNAIANPSDYAKTAYMR